VGSFSQKHNVWSIFSSKKIVNLYIVINKKTDNKKKLPKNFKVDPALTGKYADQPLFKDKIDRANHILKTVGLPKI
jgi:hypothetical protein